MSIDSAHALRIELATALRERDAEREFRGAAEAAFGEQLALTEAAESERDALRAEVKRLREDVARLLTGARENLYMEAGHERCIDCGTLIIDDSHKPTCRVPGPRGAALASGGNRG